MYLNTASVIPIDSLIGQHAARAAAIEKCQAAAAGAPFASFGMFDPPGFGKTALGKAIGAYIQELTADDPVSEQVHCIYINLKGTINKTDGLATEFFNVVRRSHRGGPRLLVILDEYGTDEAKGSFQTELAAILSKVGGESRGGETINLYGLEDGQITYDPTRLAFIILSWNPKKAAADLRTRFPQPAEFALAPYTPEELQQILEIQAGLYSESHAQGLALTFSPYARGALSRSLRGCARDVEPLLKKVASATVAAAQVGEQYKVKKENLAAVMLAVGIMPHGLNTLEVRILRALDKARATRGMRVTDLQTNTGESAKIVNAALQYLQHQLGVTGLRGQAAEPFQLYNEDGSLMQEEGKNCAGPLVLTHQGKICLSIHGARILAICKACGFCS